MLKSVALAFFALSSFLSASAQSSTPAPSTAPAAGADSLPPGPGKAILQRMCVGCHRLDVVTSKRATPDNWASTVQLMVSRGADGTDDEIDVLTKYLSTSFPAAKDDKAAPAPASATPPSGSPTSRLGRIDRWNKIDPRFLTQITPTHATTPKS
jgi:mono/diheme cytochrome c family protein